MEKRILDTIHSPGDLKKVPEKELVQLCRELREQIIDECSEHPGHFASGLGVIELTVALHYVFDTPHDHIIWDVGHQAYAHKILTGRREQFHTNRQYKGISGFPKRSESEHDSFGTGHSSTSISAALGMAVADRLSGENDRLSVAVIGDGSMTGGEAFEGLNNAGSTNANLLVILNDNNMAIDPNVGGMNEYLLDISTSKGYNKLKEDVWRVLGRINKITPGVRNFIQKIDNSIKSLMMKQSNLFEALGFRYFGPVDGHDVLHLVRVLRDLKEIHGPRLLHCITVKGKGFEAAEADQTLWHAPGKFNKETGEVICEPEEGTPPRYQDVFGHTLLELARENDRIVGITPAMPTGCSLNIMMKEMPERCFDVGIAEQHAVTFSAGLAAEGYIPFCNIYSSFMQRAYDQVIHDVAIQKLPVVFCLDRGGLVGADGATHHGAFDLAAFRSIPDLIVSAPLNEEELRNLMYTAQLPGKGPFSIRYPRGKGTCIHWRTPFREVEIGKGACIREGNDIAILSLGAIGKEALKAIDSLPERSIALYNMIFLKPIDNGLLHEVCRRFSTIVTLEEGTIVGGLGSAVAEFMADHGYTARLVRLGIPDRFIEHGSTPELFRECGIDADSIARALADCYTVTA